MKAYPDDLRKKVLTAYQEGKGSMRQLTGKSDISPTSVSGLIKNFRQNGHIRPEPHGGVTDYAHTFYKYLKIFFYMIIFITT